MAAEGRGERADAGDAYGEADLRNPQIRLAQQMPRALDPARQEVLVWRLAERAPESPAEVARRDVRRARERLEIELLGVAAVDEIASVEEMAREWGGGHAWHDAEPGPGRMAAGSLLTYATRGRRGRPSADGLPRLGSTRQESVLNASTKRARVDRRKAEKLQLDLVETGEQLSGLDEARGKERSHVAEIPVVGSLELCERL